MLTGDEGYLEPYSRSGREDIERELSQSLEGFAGTRRSGRVAEMRGACANWSPPSSKKLAGHHRSAPNRRGNLAS